MFIILTKGILVCGEIHGKVFKTLPEAITWMKKHKTNIPTEIYELNRVCDSW